MRNPLTQSGLGKVLVYLLVNIIPIVLLVTSICDLFEVINSPGGYPFGNCSDYSIYKSQDRYFLFNLIFSIALLLTIVLSFTKMKQAYFLLLFVSIILFIYPMLFIEG